MLTLRPNAFLDDGECFAAAITTPRTSDTLSVGIGRDRTRKGDVPAVAKIGCDARRGPYLDVAAVYAVSVYLFGYLVRSRAGPVYHPEV